MHQGPVPFGGYGRPAPRPTGPSAFQIVVVVFAAAIALGFGGCLVYFATHGEKPADVANPKTHASAAFRLSHPGNWTIDDDGDIPGAKQLFVESPGACMVVVTVFEDSIEPAEAIRIQEKEVKRLGSDMTRTPFTRWGSFTGEGIALKGKILLIPGWMRIFAHQGDTRSFSVMEYCYDEDRSAVQPGFEQIERSFTLLP
jgi:hypothetical protein